MGSFFVLDYNSSMKISDILSASPPIPPNNALRTLSGPEKVWKCFDLHMQGLSISELSTRFAESKEVVIEWLDAARKEHAAYLQTHTGIDLATNAVYEAELLKKLAMDELRAMREAGIEIDSAGNEIRTKAFDHKAYATYLKVVQDIVKQKIDMLMKMGALPTQAERMHHTITGEVKVTGVEDLRDKVDTRTADEIERDIMDRLPKTRRLTQE